MDDINIDGLTENESEIIRSTLNILAIKENQINIVTELIEKCDEITETFSTIPDIAHQGAFLINMYKRGINLMCNQDHEEVYEIFKRHPKYNIKIEHVEYANQSILDSIINHLEKKQNDDKAEEKCPEIQSVRNAWSKLQKLFIILMTAAYNENDKKPSDKKIAKYRKRVFRSITVRDIDDVLDSWKLIIAASETSCAALARLLSKEKSILKVFHQHNINIASQAEVILNMIDKALAKLNDIDGLIPWLKQLGHKHGDMNINPRLLALMKPVLVNFCGECLGFQFDDKLKESWVRIISFIIGMMMEGSRHGGDKQSTVSSMGGDSFNDDGGSPMITQEDIKLTQETWSAVQKVLDIAIRSFYKDLITTKAEIRNLFNASNMEQQASRLVRAIGSTISLLSEPEELEPILEELGRRHVYYSVQPRHFKYLKLAWFRMLENALALKWTPEVKQSWNNVWRYITTIMKNALEDALLLYTPPEGEKVKVKILINHIDRIETQNMSYWADIWYAAFTNNNPSQSASFGAETYNKEMKEKQNKTENETNLVEAPAWNLTSLNVMNCKDIYRENGEAWCKKFESAQDDKCEWYTRGNMSGVFSQFFDLRSFPVDQHILQCKFSLQIDESIATFDDDNLRVRLMPFKLDMMGGTDWDVFEPKIYINRESAIIGGSASGKRYSHCIIDIPIARKWQHHIWDTFLPLFLIEIFSFSVYFCAANPIAKRMSVIATLLLTLFTFKITISESMPPTPYSTLMDYFFHSAKSLLAIHVIFQVLITSYEDTLDIINVLCGAISLFIFLLSNGILLIRMYLLIKKYPKKQSGFEASAIHQISKSAMQSMKTTINTTINQSMNVSMSRRNISESHIAIG